ncbi:LysM-like peptidoglycan-binding domain-containing protein [Vibrio sp. TH_r3]|uniref:OapA family protein n=1 Tax=Vibrio sp. TH_r3 TaxID=3082084 RepID=UPI0029533431|nr:LysM-like peptidoglycan-binding domain-containing protein [Vibrio sp. TH_r3]MDV7105651.1 LysM-like peptidoglycan-binding domain-containing protein [Vibrio sp. TH_r3]
MNRRNRNKNKTSLFDRIQKKVTQFSTNSGAADSADIDSDNIEQSQPHSRIKFWANLPKFHQRALMILSPIVLVLILLPTPNMSPSTTQSSVVEVDSTRKEVAIETVSLSEEGNNKPRVTKTEQWQEYVVQSGDTLAKVFRANNLPMADLNALVDIEGLDKPLSKIREGQLIRFKLASEGHLDILQLEKSGTSVMFFRLSDGGYGRSK